MAHLDPRAPWVGFKDGAKVRVESVAYLDGDQSQGRLGIYVFALWKKFPVWGTRYRQILPGSVDDFSTMPDFHLDMTGGNFDPGKGQRGPLRIECGDAFVDGMGLPLNRHVIYVVTFQLLQRTLV